MNDLFSFLKNSANDGSGQKSSVSAGSDKPVEYQIKFMKRKTLAIHILDDGAVEVRAPNRFPKKAIHDFVLKNLNWTLEKARQRKQIFQQKQGVTYLLGKPYEIECIQGTTAVQFLSNQCLIQSPQKEVDSSQSESLLILEQWKREFARNYLKDRVAFWFPILQSHTTVPVKLPEIRIRKMRTRWGSCSSKGHINLALNLIDQHADFIDQVVVHELCHLAEFNHSTRFYRLMDEVMPAWRSAEAKLISL